MRKPRQVPVRPGAVDRPVSQGDPVSKGGQGGSRSPGIPVLGKPPPPSRPVNHQRGGAVRPVRPEAERGLGHPPSKTST